MNHTSFRHGSFQGGSSSDEDLVEVAGGMLDFSMADDVPPLDREMVEGNLSQLAMLPLVPRGSPSSAKAQLLCGEEERLAVVAVHIECQPSRREMQPEPGEGLPPA